MSCEIRNETGPTTIYDHQSCIACRYDGHTNGIEPLLAPGVFYPKCSLIVQPEEGCEPMTLLADLASEKGRIVGITKCDVDLREVTEGDNFPCGILTNVQVDPNYICWPEGTTVDQIDQLVRTSKSCLTFMRRMHCQQVPAELQYLLENKVVVDAKASVTTTTKVPVNAPRPAKADPKTSTTIGGAA